jgi:hypothetical protein
MQAIEWQLRDHHPEAQQIDENNEEEDGHGRP